MLIFSVKDTFSLDTFAETLEEVSQEVASMHRPAVPGKWLIGTILVLLASIFWLIMF